MAQKGINISPERIAEAVARVMASLGEGSANIGMVNKPNGNLDAGTAYPLAKRRPDLVLSASGMRQEDITLKKVLAGQIAFDDIKIRAETLEYQAQIAESVGRPHLAANMRRAAEMTRIPDERLLAMYNALRPYRSTKQELLDIARELGSDYQARICADLVREAAEVYEKRGRLKQA